MNRLLWIEAKIATPTARATAETMSDEPQRAASTGAAEKAAPEPPETRMACRNEGHGRQGSERDAEIVRPSSDSSTIGVTGRE